MGGRGAVSSTVASTKQSVIMLQTRSVDMLSRSSAGGVIDFSDGQHHNATGVRSGFSSRSRFSPGKRLGERASTFGGSRSASSSSTGGDGIEHTRTTRFTGVIGGRSIPAKANLPRGLSFAPRSVSNDSRLAPTLAPVHESDIEEAPVASGLDRAAYSEPGVTPAYAGPTAVGTVQRQSERDDHSGSLGKKAAQDREETTAAGRIGEFLSALPLSKLKIVIGM